MRSGITKFTRLLLALALCCGMLFSLMPATNASAAKMTNKKAQKILNKKIKNKFCKYAFVDIDKDKIDEMVVLGFSGKFTESGDDEKKTLTVYKVSGKKAKAVLSYSIAGDPYYPTLSFEMYYSDTSYIVVNELHEGYEYFVTYKYTSGKYKEISRIVEYIAETEIEYYIGKKEVSEEEYVEFISDIIEGEVDIELKSCSTKIANKYLQKQLMAYYKYTYYDEEIPIEATSPIFSDEDGDGIDELIVRKGPQGGIIYHAEPMEGNIGEYRLDYYEYSLNTGMFGDDDGPMQ